MKCVWVTDGLRGRFCNQNQNGDALFYVPSTDASA